MHLVSGCSTARRLGWQVPTPTGGNVLCLEVMIAVDRQPDKTPLPVLAPCQPSGRPMAFANRSSGPIAANRGWHVGIMSWNTDPSRFAVCEQSFAGARFSAFQPIGPAADHAEAGVKIAVMFPVTTTKPDFALVFAIVESTSPRHPVWNLGRGSPQYITSDVLQPLHHVAMHVKQSPQVRSQ